MRKLIFGVLLAALSSGFCFGQHTFGALDTNNNWTGNNTHNGSENFNGPVVFNGTFTFGNQTGCLLATVGIVSVGSCPGGTPQTWPTGPGIMIYNGSLGFSASRTAPSSAICGISDTQTLQAKTFDTVLNTFLHSGNVITGVGTPALYWDAGATITWTGQPSGVTEWISSTNRRQQYDLTNFTQFRLVLAVATGGATAAKLGVQFSTNSGSTWSFLETGGGITHEVGFNTAGSPLTGSWVNIATSGKADVQLRIIGVGGDGSTSPVFTSVAVELR